MNKSIIQVFKDRLINYSGRNQTLCRNKLYAKRAFDIFNLDEETKEKVLTSLIQDSSKKVTLVDINKKVKLSKEEKSEVVNNLSKLVDKSNIKMEFNKEELDEIKNNDCDEKLKQKAIDLCEEDLKNNKITKKHKLTDNLNKLFNEIDAKERETGLYEMYLGYPFIEGKLLDGKSVRCPLFLFPSYLEKEDGKWLFKNLNHDKIYINKVFLMAYKENYEISITHIEEEYEDVEEFFKLTEKINTLEEILPHLMDWGKENNINLSNELFRTELEKVSDYTMQSYKKYKDGDLFLRNQAVLGSYSVGSNGIYKELEQMAELDMNKNVNDFLYGDVEAVSKDEITNTEIKLNERENNFVTELDNSQEKAVKISETVDNSVIYGPPGTGKSQVIANIVADYLARGKKVLVVSEKRTALDVVYKRLQKLNLHKNLAFIHDSKKDREIVMEKIRENYEIAVNNKLEDNIEEFNKKSNEIQENVDRLDKLAKELHEQRNMGYSLFQLYSSTKLSASYIKEIFDNFRKYNDFDRTSLKEMLEKLENLKERVHYDKDGTLISMRKDFSGLITTEKRVITNLLDEIEEILEKETYLYHEDKLEKEIQNIDIKNLWLNKNQENKDLYSDIEEINNKLAEYKKTFFLMPKKFKLKKELRNKLKVQNISEKETELEDIFEAKKTHEEFGKSISSKTLSTLEKVKLVESNIELEDRKEIKILSDKIKELKEKITKLEKHFDIKLVEDMLSTNKSEKLKELSNLIDKDFNKIKSYDSSKSKLEELEKKILDNFIKSDEKHYLTKLENTYLLKWIEEVENEVGEALVTIDEYQSIKEKVYDGIQEKKELVPIKINREINEKIKELFEYNRLGNEVHYRNIISEANRKRKKMPLRKYVEKFQDEGLFNLLPCWLLTPEIVSEILPLKDGLFDILIFDEASQMFVEKSLPSIFRGKKVVVAGDDKQLKPTSIGQKRTSNELEGDLVDEEMESNEETAYDVESLLDLAKQRYKSTLLSYHYRSKHPELINFSNYAFYDGKLIVAPTKDELEKPPIEVIKVEDGIWENQSNNAEAVEVYRLVKKILLERENNESIGIVTFNAKQQELIKKYLDDISIDDVDFRALYEKEKIRYDGTEDQSLFVKNIENVQGDERDIIIFSTAYAKDIKTSRVANRFGTLGQFGGENRLNVAISRAKQKIYMVTSIEPEELSVESTKNIGPKLLKKYLTYTRAVSNKDKEQAKTILNSLYTMQEVKDDVIDQFDSPFEEEVCTRLRDLGYIVHTQVGDSGYRIDLSVYDKEKSSYILGIECDGATYHSSPSARERDIYRQKFLEMKGWKIHRIWSRNWWENPSKEIEKVVEVIENIKSY